MAGVLPLPPQYSVVEVDLIVLEFGQSVVSL
jgi:hypothetical protein